MFNPLDGVKKIVGSMFGNNEPKQEQKADTSLTDWLFKTLYETSKSYDRAHADKRRDNVRFFKGDQWRRSQPSYMSKSVSNFLSLIVRDEVAILTDSLPTINVRPVDFDSDPEMAVNFTKLINHILYKNNFGDILHEAVKTASIEGIAYIYPYWDALMGDLGDVRICNEKAPMKGESGGVGRDPSGEDNWFFIEKSVSLAEIKRRYPDKYDMVKADKRDDRNQTVVANKKPPMPVQSTDGSQTFVIEPSGTEVMNQYEKVDFHIWWLRDESVKSIRENPDDETTETQEAAYPHGRWIITANRKVILEDKPCMVRHFPLVPVILDTDPESKIEGTSVIDYVKQLQVDYNEISALQKDWYRYTLFPRVTADPKSRVNARNIERKPGSVIPAAPGEVNFNSPPALSNDSFTHMGTLKNNLMDVGGNNNISRKAVTGLSTDALRRVDEASKTLLRPKSRLIESSVKRLGELLIDYIQAGYTTERTIRLLGQPKPPDVPPGTPIPPGMPTPDQVMVLNQIKIQEGVQKMLNDVSVGEYDVYVEPDSTLPKSDIERSDRLLSLANIGFVDRPALLQVSGLPNWQEIDKRMAQKEEEIKAIQAQQAAMAVTPGSKGEAPPPGSQV